MADIKLLLSDVDGTLVTSKRDLTPRTVAAVQALRARGIAFAVTSGRPPRGMRMLAEPLALATPLGGFNGGMWVTPDQTLIEAHCLPASIATRCLHLVRDFGLEPWVFTDNDWKVPDAATPHAVHEQGAVQYAPTVTADFTPFLGDVIKLVGVSDDLDRVRACAAKITAELGATVSATRSQPYYVDITHPMATKGVAVAFLAARLGIPPAQIATIGDGENDTLMFAASGLSIAMGNAPDHVKEQATHVTASNNADGFAGAVERFILGGADV